MLIPVILSGGSGTRLWPLSRELYPKQLLQLVGSGTMLQETAARLDGVDSVAPPIVVCNENHRFMVAEQLCQLGKPADSIVLEPVGRNTAPAVAVAAFAAQDAVGPSDDPILLVLPADHVIRDAVAFRRTLRLGVAAAREGSLATFGVVPDKPETGYGYIRRHPGDGPTYPVAEFVEKPDRATAEQYVASGCFYWNSGMFVFRARVFLDELLEHSPAIYAAAEAAYRSAHRDLDFLRLDVEQFAACPSDSIDYAIMEHTKKAVVVPLDAGWSDVGSWSALYDATPADDNGNVCVGDVLTSETRGCYVHSTSRLVATVGLVDHVVVETKDAVFVAPRERAQDAKNLVALLAAHGRDEASLHRQVARPWGSYDRIDSGERFQVKRLVVNPGASLSRQLHHHRAEHWIVVSGIARVTRGDEVFLLEENQSTYIPIGATHRIDNPGMIPLHIIEVQSGSYLGEDDIVRFDDVYGRHDRGASEPVSPRAMVVPSA